MGSYYDVFDIETLKIILSNRNQEIARLEAYRKQIIENPDSVIAEIDAGIAKEKQSLAAVTIALSEKLLANALKALGK